MSDMKLLADRLDLTFERTVTIIGRAVDSGVITRTDGKVRSMLVSGKDSVGCARQLIDIIDLVDTTAL